MQRFPWFCILSLLVNASLFLALGLLPNQVLNRNIPFLASLNDKALHCFAFSILTAHFWFLWWPVWRFVYQWTNKNGWVMVGWCRRSTLHWIPININDYQMDNQRCLQQPSLITRFIVVMGGMSVLALLSEPLQALLSNRQRPMDMMDALWDVVGVCATSIALAFSSACIKARRMRRWADRWRVEVPLDNDGIALQPIGAPYRRQSAV